LGFFVKFLWDPHVSNLFIFSLKFIPYLFHHLCARRPPHSGRWSTAPPYSGAVSPHTSVAPPLLTLACAALHQSGHRRRSSPLRPRQARELRRARPSATGSPEPRWPTVHSTGGRRLAGEVRRRPAGGWRGSMEQAGGGAWSRRPVVAGAGEGGGRSRRGRRPEQERAAAGVGEDAVGEFIWGR
jgi:hypothetical protein